MAQRGPATTPRTDGVDASLRQRLPRTPQPWVNGGKSQSRAGPRLVPIHPGATHGRPRPPTTAHDCPRLPTTAHDCPRCRAQLPDCLQQFPPSHGLRRPNRDHAGNAAVAQPERTCQTRRPAARPTPALNTVSSAFCGSAASHRQITPLHSCAICIR
ncbi:hypothetical protein BS50DRAFT_194616 [Corynespora cassiicola Philippines]|uniref:Uncharacterized protein n=1 Tax=Corynespora cassiicola Philippines TaxID=1448308 RepID=A0A2T2P7W0_CORCC|nr:hypothetical protein BS50DRAFT_194616 [Corynespora cassiicola Philippines]